MRRSADFSIAVRAGRRARRGAVVVHQLTRSEAGSAEPALVGFIVGRSVGSSVIRHRTTRRLRAIMAGRLAELPAGSSTVVRALPDAAAATCGQLAGDVGAALGRLVPKTGS